MFSNHIDGLYISSLPPQPTNAQIKAPLLNTSDTSEMQVCTHVRTHTHSLYVYKEKWSGRKNEFAAVTRTNKTGRKSGWKERRCPYI